MATFINISGNLGKDAEVRTNSSTGNNFTVFTIASNKTIVDRQSGEKRQITTWFECLYHGDKIANYLKKGDLVHIESDSIKADVYINDEGKAIASLKVNVRKIHFLASVKRDEVNTGETEIEADDLPF